MKWIYLCLNLLVLFVCIHGKPYSIHVSIHYPKGANKRPEIYVSEGNKGEIIKDIKVIEQPDESEAPMEEPLHNPQTPQPQPLYPRDPRGAPTPPGEPQIVVPTETERYHMKKSEKRTVHEKHQNQVDIPKDSVPRGLENDKQDDPRPVHHRRRLRKKHLKETFWNYKNMPPMRKNLKVIRSPAGSSQTYDMAEVKAYERLGQKLPYGPEELEYREGEIEKPPPSPREPAHRLDYDVPSPNRRGPAEKLDVAVDTDKEPYNDRADDFESYHPFRKDDSSKVRILDYKSFDPYDEMKQNIKDGYNDISIVKGCLQVGHMMPNPDDRCGYLECVHAEEQHFTQDLVAQQRKCAPGTAVPYSWRGGLDNPCTEAAAYCKNVHEVEDIEEEIHSKPSAKTPLHDEGIRLQDDTSNAKQANSAIAKKE